MDQRAREGLSRENEPAGWGGLSPVPGAATPSARHPDQTPGLRFLVCKEGPAAPVFPGAG